MKAKKKAETILQRSNISTFTIVLSFRFSVICFRVGYFSVWKCFVAIVKKNSYILLQTFWAKVFNNHFLLKT